MWRDREALFGRELSPGGVSRAFCIIGPVGVEYADRALIVAARNALPALLDALDAAEARERLLLGFIHRVAGMIRAGFVEGAKKQLLHAAEEIETDKDAKEICRNSAAEAREARLRAFALDLFRVDFNREILFDVAGRILAILDSAPSDPTRAAPPEPGKEPTK